MAYNPVGPTDEIDIEVDGRIFKVRVPAGYQMLAAEKNVWAAKIRRREADKSLYVGRHSRSSLRVIVRMATVSLAKLNDTSREGSANVQRQSLNAPKSGLWLLSLFAPQERLDEILGDQEETYVKQVARFGLRLALAWYWWVVLCRSVGFGVRGIVSLIPLGELARQFRSR